MSIYFYDRKGQPLTIEQADRLLSDFDYKRVGLDYVGHVRVSTVWLGVDHSFRRGGPPVIFETMLFGGEHDQYQARYVSEADAAAGHARIVKALQEGRGPYDGQED